jgi:hypothetical protein
MTMRTNHHFNDGAPLSQDQKARLNILAKEAFDELDRHGLIEAEGRTKAERLKNWRRAEQFKAVRIESLTQCQNRHFRTLRGHFLALVGKEDKAYKDYVTTGKVRARAPEMDTHENRELWRYNIRKLLSEHERVVTKPATAGEFQRGEIALKKGGAIGMAYAVSEAKRKYPERALTDLTATELRIIHDHLQNRIRAREGRGDSKKRNMAQRKAKKGGAA